MKKIFIDEDQVTTLAELAKELAAKYGWTSYEVQGADIYFKANADGEPVNGRLETSGFAYDVESGESIDEWDVDWDEDFDGWSNHVWAEDENGGWSFSRRAGRGGIGEFSVPASAAAGNYEGMLFKLGRRVGRSAKIISVVSSLLGEKFLERGGKADSKKLVEISDGLIEKLERMDGMELPDGRGKFKYSDFKYGFLARL